MAKRKVSPGTFPASTLVEHVGKEVLVSIAGTRYWLPEYDRYTAVDSLAGCVDPRFLAGRANRVEVMQ